MVRKITKTLILSAVLAIAVSASVFAFSFSDIVAWAGNGSNQAALVIDWNDGVNPECYVWGFRWDGTATGEDMFNAIVNAYPDLVPTIISSSFGNYIDGIQYGPHYQGGWDPNLMYFWNYNTAENTTIFPNTWTSSSVGFSQRQLSNNSWDGWAWGPWVTAPNSPTAAPVPEPASLLALSLGVSPVLYKVRKRS